MCLGLASIYTPHCLPHETMPAKVTKERMTAFAQFLRSLLFQNFTDIEKLKEYGAAEIWEGILYVRLLYCVTDSAVAHCKPPKGVFLGCTTEDARMQLFCKLIREVLGRGSVQKHRFPDPNKSNKRTWQAKALEVPLGPQQAPFTSLGQFLASKLPQPWHLDTEGGATSIPTAGQVWNHAATAAG